MLAGIILDEEVGDGGAGDDEGGGTEDGEEEYSGWADMGGHWDFFLRFGFSRGSREGVGVMMGFGSGVGGLQRWVG